MRTYSSCAASLRMPTRRPAWPWSWRCPCPGSPRNSRSAWPAAAEEPLPRPLRRSLRRARQAGPGRRPRRRANSSSTVGRWLVVLVVRHRFGGRLLRLATTHADVTDRFDALTEAVGDGLNLTGGDGESGSLARFEQPAAHLSAEPAELRGRTQELAALSQQRARTSGFLSRRHASEHQPQLHLLGPAQEIAAGDTEGHPCSTFHRISSCRRSDPDRSATCISAPTSGRTVFTSFMSQNSTREVQAWCAAVEHDLQPVPGTGLGLTIRGVRTRRMEAPGGSRA